MKERERVMLVGKEKMTVSGKNPPPPMDEWEKHMMNMEKGMLVSHEDVDTDEQRKSNNVARHSSYRR